MRHGHRIKFNALALVALMSSAAFVSMPSIALADDETQDPVDILVVVDESASLSSAAVRSEKAALKEIISSEELVGRGIRVGVLPFSSGANSPRVVSDCALSFIGGDDDGRRALDRCADQIVRQRKRGSADTDFAGAISKALDTFDRDDATKVLLLLTDGKYDPDGNETISIEEQSRLDEVLASANSKQVSMWALGFGKADKKALTEYVGKTSQGDAQCPTRPEAVLGTEVDLAVELRRIIDHATCTGRDTGQADPVFNFPVSPLISKLLIEVSNRGSQVSLADAEVTNADGVKVCEDAESVDGRWKCRVDVGGGDGGIWKVVSKKSDRVLDVLVTWTGAIEVMAANCVVKENASPAAVVKVFRSDKEAVDFSVDGDIKWPKVVVDISQDSTKIRRVELDLDAEEKAILGIEEAPVGSDIDISVARESADERLIVRFPQISNCTLVSETPTTTPTTSATPPKGGTGSSVPTSVPPPPQQPAPTPPWWILLVAVIVLGVSFFLWRNRRAKTFPEGSELARQNTINRAVYEPIADIAGYRQVYLDVIVDGQNVDVVVLDGRSGARYKLTRVDETAIQIESLYQHNIDAEDEVETGVEIDDDRQTVIVENNQEFNVRDSDPSVATDKSTAVYLKVVTPEEFLEGEIE